MTSASALRRAGRPCTRPPRPPPRRRARARRRAHGALRADLGVLDPDVDGQRRGVVDGLADGLSDRPQFGSPPCSGRLHERRAATARAAATTPRGRRGRPRARPASRPRRRAPSAAPGAAAGSRALAEAHLVLGLGRLIISRRRSPSGSRCRCGELAVDGDAVEGAFDADAEQQVGGLGRQRARRSGRSRASSRTRARSSSRPWPGRSAGRCRKGSATSSDADLANLSVVRIASPNVSSP